MTVRKGETDYSTFQAITISRSDTFELDIGPTDAFPLFTAPGETLWVPGWRPFILSGDSYQTGTAWVTQAHDHTTYWHVADYDDKARHARYVRVTPEADSATVDVTVAPNGNDGSTVHVTYQSTGLSQAGNENIGKMLAPAQYTRMMEHWLDLIRQNRAKIDDHFGRSTAPE